MQALRLNEVLTRVVAWHNRHPLARRITASHVHSVGEVVLPFASAQPAPAPATSAPTLPALQELLAAQPAAGLLPEALPGPSPSADVAADVARSVTADAPADARRSDSADSADSGDEAAVAGDAEAAPVPTAATQADDLFGGDMPAADDDPFADPVPSAEAGADGAVAAVNDAVAVDDDAPDVLIDLSADSGDTAAPADVAAPDETWADPAATVAASAELAAAFATVPDTPQASASREASSIDADDAAQYLTAPEPMRSGTAPMGAALAAPPASLRASWLARLARLPTWLLGRRVPASGSAALLPKLQATFSRDFIWPLRPGQVARWARHHGSLQALAPQDWPQRLIDTDSALMARARQQHLVHDLPVHLLTAAIGVGDRRIRVLIDARGRVIGPRSYSPPRLASVASVLAIGLVGAGGAWLPRGNAHLAPELAAAVAAAASAAAQAASAAELAAAAMTAAELLSRTAVADAGLAPATAPELIAEPTAPAAPANAASHGAAPGPAQAPAQPEPPDHDAPVTPAARQTAADQASGAAHPPLRLARLISDADKQAARAQAQALRGVADVANAAANAATGPREPGPVYAVVTRPTAERDSAARGLALMRASRQRLTGVPPEHGELMRHGNEWRAAWWPFDSQADAERARILLTARGLKADVVEF